VRRELDNLVKLGIVRLADDLAPSPDASPALPVGLNKKKYYQLNKGFVLHEELSSLFAKSHVLWEKDLADQLAVIPNLQLLIMTGFFTNVQEAMTDILLVGSLPRQQVGDLIDSYERKLGRPIKYTIISLKEYEYRRDVTDKFLYDILVNQKIVIVDRVGLQDEHVSRQSNPYVSRV
jgi:hypothetical protein